MGEFRLWNNNKRSHSSYFTICSFELMETVALKWRHFVTNSHDYTLKVLRLAQRSLPNVPTPNEKELWIEKYKNILRFHSICTKTWSWIGGRVFFFFQFFVIYVIRNGTKTNWICQSFGHFFHYVTNYFSSKITNYVLVGVCRTMKIFSYDCKCCKNWVNLLF